MLILFIPGKVFDQGLLVSSLGSRVLLARPASCLTVVGDWTVQSIQKTEVSKAEVMEVEEWWGFCLLILFDFGSVPCRA